MKTCNQASCECAGRLKGVFFYVIILSAVRILLMEAFNLIERSTGPKPMNSIDWEALYFEYLPRVFNFFRYRVGNGVVAEDLTAETFEKAWKHRQRYNQNMASFGTWLFTIARNVSIDYFRRQKNLARVDESKTEFRNNSIEEAIDQSEELSQLNQLLEGMSKHEKELVALKYGSGMTYKEIALLTGLSETNVGTILYRVVKKIRERWEEIS
jgi:RNA polymerase sigma-70 factor, ECF subfamily